MKKWIVCLFLFVCAAGLAQAKTAKNVIWVIADGMGPGSMGLLMEAVRNTDLPAYPDKTSRLEKFISESELGVYFNNTYDTVVTDSACAATQMACGVKSRPDFIGQDFNGQNVQSIMELAKENGKSVGVISDAYVTDATPAGFLAHTRSRKNKYEIARQMIAAEPQVIMGGGLKYFTQGENKKLVKEAKKEGYRVATNVKELAKIKKGKILGLFADEAMPFYVEKDRYPQTPTLLDMTQKAVEVMSENEDGFFLMVEAGKVDWALHDNELGATLYEMLNLDETLAYVYEFAKQNGDTLVYLNADHETGVPAFHYRHLDEETVQHKSAQGEMLYGGNTDYVSYAAFDRLLKQKRMLYYMEKEFKALPKEQQTVEKLQELVDESLGYHMDISKFENPFDYKSLIRQINEQEGIVWATDSHSSGMLLGVAYGGFGDFGGVYHNTDLKDKFIRAAGLEQKD